MSLPELHFCKEILLFPLRRIISGSGIFINMTGKSGFFTTTAKKPAEKDGEQSGF
ncbi:MAG: hypothetical protein ACRBCL_15255 [Maritimibacter sp.]